jgi:hypothetical protein
MRQKGDNLRGWSLVPTQRVIGRADRWRRDGRERTQGFWGTLLRGLWAWTLCALWGLARGLRCRLLP